MGFRDDKNLTNSTMRSPKSMFSAAMLLLLTGIMTGAQAASAEQAQSPGEMEEVTVYGEKSLLQLERELIEAQDNAFALFNSLNADHQYDIHCYKKAPTGSHIKKRICFPNFVHTLQREMASRSNPRNRMNMLVEGMIWVNMTKMEEKNKALRGVMDTLSMEHTELANALKAYSDAKHLFVTESEKRCRRLIFICLEQ